MSLCSSLEQTSLNNVWLILRTLWPVLKLEARKNVDLQIHRLSLILQNAGARRRRFTGGSFIRALPLRFSKVRRKRYVGSGLDDIGAVGDAVDHAFAQPGVLQCRLHIGAMKLKAILSAILFILTIGLAACVDADHYGPRGYLGFGYYDRGPWWGYGREFHHERRFRSRPFWRACVRPPFRQRRSSWR